MKKKITSKIIFTFSEADLFFKEEGWWTPGATTERVPLLSGVVQNQKASSSTCAQGTWGGDNLILQLFNTIS